MKKTITAVTPIRSDFPAVSGIRDISGFLRFVEWAATPKHLRDPEHQKDFAAQIGVCEDSLTDWKKHPQFFLLVNARVSAWARERIPDVIGSLYEKAYAKGTAGDVKLFLQIAGMQVGGGKK